jgi:CTP:molybdopterin cytidylyltransferase MocA
MLLLAAGAARRFGAPKQLLQREGETLVHRAARLGLATQPADAVLVHAAGAAPILAAVADLPVRLLECAESGRGMGASLQAGLAALAPACDAALVLLCDQPALTAEHLQALLAAWRRAPLQAVASAYAGTRGVPALLPRSWFGLIAADGDRGARALLRQRPDVSAVTAEALALDVDRPKQWERWA